MFLFFRNLITYSLGLLCLDSVATNLYLRQVFSSFAFCFYSLGVFMPPHSTLYYISSLESLVSQI